MLQKINSTNFKGSLLLKASEGSREGLLELQVFNTDDIKDIQKLSNKATVIVYYDKIAKEQVPYYIPSDFLSTNEIINAYTAACQNRNINISI